MRERHAPLRREPWGRGRCVDAERFEVSDRNNKIEGNPGVFSALGLLHSDGRNCAGSGGATVTLTMVEEEPKDESDSEATTAE